MNLRINKMIMLIIKSCPIALLMLSLSNCGSNGKSVTANNTDGFQQSHGPFDSDGNYVESWADQAPKRKFSWGRSASTEPETSSSSSSSTSTSIARASTPKKTYTSTKKSVSTKSYSAPKKTAYTSPKKSTPKKSTPSRSKTTNKSTAKKITPKTKPPISHTVKKGDTLYSLSRKYGTSVSAIQKANRLSGTSISIGKRLVIPRK